MNKRINMKKITFAIALALGTIGAANAQWSVQDVNSNAMKKSLDELVKGVKTQITNQDAQQSAIEVMSKQQSVQMEEQDKRNRGNAALADSIKRNRDAVPTIQQCVDLTRGKSAGAGGAAARGGSGSNGKDLVAEASKINSSTDRLAAAIAKVKENKACGVSPMERASKFCSTGGSGQSQNVGNTAAGLYPGANVSPRSLMGNFYEKVNRDYINYTLNADAQKAASSYLTTSVTTHFPPQLKGDLIKYNESYLPAYYRVTNGLTTAYDAMSNVQNFYNEFTAESEMAEEFSEFWTSLKPVYEKMNMKMPDTPSLTELYLAEVNQDYYYIKTPFDDEDSSEIENLRQINRKLALSNFMQARSVNLQEYQVILLADLVKQQYTEEAERLTVEANRINSLAINPGAGR